MGPEITLLLGMAIGFWGLTAILAIPNLVLIASLKMSRRLRLIQSAIFLTCVVLTIVLFAGGFQSMGSVTLTAFGIPILIIGQFIYLFILRQRLRIEI